MRRTTRLGATLAVVLLTVGCAWSAPTIAAPAPEGVVDTTPPDPPSQQAVAVAVPTGASANQADTGSVDSVVAAQIDLGSTGSGLGAAAESTVWIPAGDHLVPGTLALPDPAAAAPAAAVLLLHGDLSSRDENGGLFARLAAILAANGIASLRVDFAGSGDSPEPDLALDYPNMVDDASASLTYLQGEGRIDPARVAVLGLSRGGAIAATVAGTRPGVSALVEWSGAVYNGYDEDPDLHDRARAAGYVQLGDDPDGFKLSLSWFDTIEQSHPLTDVTGFTGPVLAVTGSDDQVVPPETSDVLVQSVASTDTTRYIIDGADHEYQATSDDQTNADQVLGLTARWLASRLAGPSPSSTSDELPAP